MNSNRFNNVLRSLKVCLIDAVKTIIYIKKYQVINNIFQLKKKREVIGKQLLHIRNFRINVQICLKLKLCR